MFVGLCIGAVFGLSIGIMLLAWLFGGDRLKLNIPSPTSLDEHFIEPTKFWANFCVGDTKVEYIEDASCAGNSFARLQVNRGDSDLMALAQIDDYSYRPRADSSWQAPLKFELRMRFSEQNPPGSSGFYLWNNPLPMDGELASLRFLKWIGFYRVSEASDVSFFPEKTGFRATILNGRWRDVLAFAKLSFAPKLRIKEVNLENRGDWTQWHTYQIEWYPDKINMAIDDETILTYETKLKGPLSLVIWCDNSCPQINDKQFDLNMTEITTPVWIDVDYVKIQPLA